MFETPHTDDVHMRSSPPADIPMVSAVPTPTPSSPAAAPPAGSSDSSAPSRLPPNPPAACPPSATSPLPHPISVPLKPTPHVSGPVNANAMLPPNPQADSDLLRLPAELLHKVLTLLGVADPTDLATVAAVCRDLHDFIYKNPDTALWRNVLLHRYDDPRLAGRGRKLSAAVEWRERVQDRAFLERVFGSKLSSTDAATGEAGEWQSPASTVYNATLPLLMSPSEIGTEPEPPQDEVARRLAPHLDRICKALLDLYLDLPARDPATEDTGPQSFFAAPPTRNGPLLNRALRSEAFNRLYLQLLTTTVKPGRATSSGDSSGPVSGRTRSTAAPTSDGYVPPHAHPLPPALAIPLRSPANRVTGNPTLARLHVLVPAELDPDVEQHRRHRGYLRELVYGSRHYREDNDYGPFNPDGTVDWHLMNAVGTVMMLNAIDVLSLGEEAWRPALAPMSNGIEAVRGLGFGDLTRPKDLAENEVWDWAGVTGQWFGSYSFLDYSDWLYLNGLDRTFNRRGLDLSRYLEAVGDLMELHLVASHDPEAASAAYSELQGSPITLPSLDTPLPTSSVLPPVYFHGRSQQRQSSVAGGPPSFVRGVVRLTADDPPEVRWTMVIRYTGDDRWRLEGVQVCGRQSRRGFFGIWADAGRSEGSPNGPVWYWKKDPLVTRAASDDQAPGITLAAPNIPPQVANPPTVGNVPAHQQPQAVADDD